MTRLVPQGSVAGAGARAVVEFAGGEARASVGGATRCALLPRGLADPVGARASNGAGWGRADARAVFGHVGRGLRRRIGGVHFGVESLHARSDGGRRDQQRRGGGDAACGAAAGERDPVGALSQRVVLLPRGPARAPSAFLDGRVDVRRVAALEVDVAPVHQAQTWCTRSEPRQRNRCGEPTHGIEA